jgi:hypothetical protein
MIFYVPPPSGSSLLWQLMIAATLVLITLGVWDKDSGYKALFSRVLCSSLSAFFVVSLILSFTTFVRVNEDSIWIFGIYGRSIPIEDINISQAKVLQLKKSKGYAPRRRTNGLSVFGYQTGWFDNNKLVFLTSWENVVYLPTKCCALFITLSEPQRFIDEIERIKKSG